MEIGDTLVGIDHGDIGRSFIHSRDISFDLSLLVGRQVLDLLIEIANPMAHVNAKFSDEIGVLFKNVFVENLDAMPENDRVGHLHHGRFHV